MRQVVSQRAILRIWSGCWFLEREAHAVLDCGEGQLLQGREAIRAFYAGLVATGRKFAFGDQRAAIISGDLALTSTRLPNGSVTTEIARQQSDRTWLWVIDRFSVA